MALRLITPPESLPVSLDEVKAHLRVDFDDDDEQIKAYVEAATDFCEGPSGYLGRCLVDQTWDYFQDSFPSRSGSFRIALPGSYIEVPLPPLIEVVGLYYLDSDRVEQAVDPASYVADTESEPGRLYMASWPSLPQKTMNAIRIRFRAGYLDSSNSPPSNAVPSGIKTAIKLLVGTMYENRDSVSASTSTGTMMEPPFSVTALLRKHRIYTGIA